MNNKIDFRDFTGWVVVYRTTTLSPEYKEEQWIEIANSYREAYNKTQNAIQEYYARDIVIYYVVDGIAEKVINNFSTAVKNMRGKKK